MIKHSKKLSIITLFCLCVLNIFISTTKVNAEKYERNRFNVLVLNSYQQGHYWESNILDGLQTSIKNNKENINLKIEYLDFRNKNDKNYIASLKQMLKAKYPTGSIDALYTVDDESFETFKGEVLNKDSSFYKLPLVFSGVDNKLNENSEEKKYMSGIYHVDDSLPLFNLIQRLNPGTDTINLIIEDSLYCQSVKSEIDNLLEGGLKKHVKINYIQSDYIEDILYHLNELNYNENAVNIIAGEFQGKYSHKYLEPEFVIQEIKKYSSRPIYSNDQTYINAGILGGHLDIGQEHGTMIADMLIKIKNGENIRYIKNEMEPNAKAYIDYNSVYDYNINPLDISKDFNIINKKFYQMLIPRYIKLIITISIIVFIICIFILINCEIKDRKNKILLENERKREKERENLKTDFIINLSHELRTPINIILGTSQIIESNLNQENNDRKEYFLTKIDNIKQNAYRLLKISNNIIDITKAESGMLEIKLENCNIVNMIEETFTSTIDFAKRKNIEMIFDTSYEEIIMAIDKFQIQRVILNLLSNAIKFTNENGFIYTIINKQDNYIVIQIKDNGIGIPPKQINQIFHRFYQVDNLLTRKSEGSGIGLCIVKDIVEIHNGKIEIESEVNKGSNFKIYLPINTIEKSYEEDNNKILNLNSIVNLEMSDI